MPESTGSLSNLRNLSDGALLRLRANLESEMVRRGKGFSVGEIGESLAIEFFKATSGLPVLLKASGGTKNVDCLSRDGDRYSVKTLCRAKKTGTIYPDADDREKQLFEYLLLVRLDEQFQLSAIYKFSWRQFVHVRSWDKRMSAWYVGCSARTLSVAELMFPQAAPALPGPRARRAQQGRSRPLES